MTTAMSVVPKNEPRLDPISMGVFVIHEDGLEISSPPTFEQWSDMGHVFGVMHRGSGWAVGDWLIYGEEHFGEEHSQALDPRYFSEETLKVYRWVAQQVPREQRFPMLSFKHHMHVAKLTAEKQRYWLGRSVTNGWSSNKLLAAMRESDEEGTRTIWLIVKCADEQDMETLRRELEGRGRICKSHERITKAARQPKKAVTAKAKRSGKKRRG